MSRFAALEELFKGRHFDQEIVVLCVRWYLSFKLSYRDLGVQHKAGGQAAFDSARN
jgi:transposase-like protein